MKLKKIKLSAISTMHYVKLVYRALLFLVAAAVYVVGKIKGETAFEESNIIPWVMGIIWVVFAVEIAFRFFPSRLESMGCQKQFKKNYIPTGETTPKLQSWKRTFIVALSWIALNAVIGVLYFTSLIDVGILVLISLAYSSQGIVSALDESYILPVPVSLSFFCQSQYSHVTLP